MTNKCSSEFYEENRWQKLTRRIKEEPLVPFGCAITCYALYRASISIRKREHHNTNRFFRFRIYGQAFTLLCIYAGGIYYKEEREKRKQFEGALAEKRAAEKRDLWIKELEARDREENDARERKQAMAAGFRGQDTASVTFPIKK